jgi:hypothetical protein
MLRRAFIPVIAGGAAPDVTRPSVTIAATGATNNVVAISITFSEPVTGFEVGDITISAGGSLASFAGSGASYTVSWTLAAGANTMDIAEGVCADAAGNTNTAATQYAAGFLTMQPDSTADVDTVIKAGDAANYSTSANVRIGISSGAVRRALLRFDLTSLPALATISSSVLTLYQEGELSTSARRMSLYKLKRDWVVTQASWNIYSTGHTWETTGATGAADIEPAEYAGRDFSATEANGAKTFTLPATAKNDLGAYGWLIMLSDETIDNYLMTLCNGTTAANRPKLVIVYYVNP